MAGEHNLEILLRSMAPVLHPGEFVFCTGPAIMGDPIATFREGEGWSVILRRAEAERLGLAYAFPCRMITLTVHSSLDAVGFLATVTGDLAVAGISVNVVSAFHHDHLFVPSARAEQALDILFRTARRSRP
jgi:uncharacterized protein